MDGTVLQQGSFVVPATIVNQIIAIPSNADFMWVKNYTQSGAAGATAPAFGVSYYWQRGMASGTGLVTYKTNALLTDNTDTLASGGFTLYDPSGQSAAYGAAPLVGPAVAVTAVTNATRPVVSTGSTAGLQVGSIVRLSNTAQLDMNGIVGVVSAITANVSFTMFFANQNALATAPGLIGGAGFYRIIQYPLFYPRTRVITNIGTINGVANSVATATAHGFVAGQLVRFNIPAVSGSTELNSNSFNNYQTFTVQSVANDYVFTINPPVFTAFTYPTSAQIGLGSEFPIVTPVGEDTAAGLSLNQPQVPTILGQQIFNTQTGILSDATVNTGFLGMILGTGGTATGLGAAVSGPAGSVAGDVMYWVAGKSAFGGL